MTISAAGYQDIFEDLGKMVKAANGFATIAATTVETFKTDIQTILDTNDMHDLLALVPEPFEGYQDANAGFGAEMGSLFASARLTDRVTILQNLPPLTIGAGVQEVLQELYRDMVDEAEDVNGGTSSDGGVTADLYQSDGTLITNHILDGWNRPSAGWPGNLEYLQDLGNAAGSGRWPGEHLDYAGTLTELTVPSEVHTLTCTRDSETSGSSEGGETFEWVGGLAGIGPYDWREDGTGQASSRVTVANGAGIVSNGEFENWTVANTPDNWDVDAGDVGDHILQEESTVKRGDSALEFAGDGSEADIQISQTLANLTPGRRYFIACWVQGTAGTAAGDLTIQFEGTGYTAGATEKIEMDETALSAQTTYGIESFFFNTPQEIPDDFELVIKVNTTLTDTKSVFIDGLVLAPAVYHGGLCIGILAGAEKYLLGDRFEFTIAGWTEGVFQKFFRKNFQHQLPSQTDASETIADSLAT